MNVEFSEATRDATARILYRDLIEVYLGELQYTDKDLRAQVHGQRYETYLELRIVLMQLDARLFTKLQSFDQVY